MTQRLTGIDALRGLAVLLMIEQHLGVWLWDHNGSMFDYPFFLCLNGLGGFAAPVFITLAGLGVSFIEDRHGRADLRLMVRGGGVLFFGYCLNFATPNWFSPGSWYVLHMIGAALIVSPLFKRLPSKGIIIIFAAVIIATVFLQNAFETPLKLGNRRLGNYHLPGGIFRLAFLEGHFPFFPWLSFFLAGILSGRWLKSGQKKHILVFGCISLCAGTCLALFNIAGFDFAVKDPLLRACKILPRFYPALSPITLLLIGLVLIYVFAVTFIETRWKVGPNHPIVCLGRTSLTFLFVHVVVFREMSRYFHFWRKFSITETLLITFIVLIIFGICAAMWRRVDFRFGGEWLIRKIAG